MTPSLLLAAALAVVAQGPEPTSAAPPPPQRLVIPDELYLRFSAAPDDAGCPEDEAQRAEARERAEAPCRVAFADAVDLVGHIEATAGGRLVVLGRRVDPEAAEIAGGDRASLKPGALVRVVGTGGADGTVRATRLEIQAPKDPAANAKLAREVAEFEKKFWKKAKRYDNPALLAYLRDIVRRLVPTYAPESDRNFEIEVVQDPDLNAFALPGGKIVVHTGIIARLDNEAQLASVLGHEMAHVSQRHALRALEKSTEHTLVGWGSLLASLALGVTGNGGAAKGVQLMSSAWLSGYSRAHEDEADQVGLRYLYLAGYDVRQAPEVWRTFQLLYGDPTREANFFYGSHSTGRDREFNLDHEIWKSYQGSGLIGGRVEREPFQRATAGLVRDNGILDLERGNLAAAEWGLNKSLAIAPEDAATYVALGRLTLRRGGSDSLDHAIDSFRHALELDGGLAEAHRELGFALHRRGDHAAARTELQRYLELTPDAKDADSVRRAIARI